MPDSTNRGAPPSFSFMAVSLDGSGWQGVYDLLKQDGCGVRIVQNPTISLRGDVEATKMILDAQSEPVILVGQSYGGVVVTEAGNDPKVAALVYIAAFAPDQGESVETLIADPPPGAPVPPILPPQDGFLFLDRERFHASFARDLSAEEAAFMADSQVPWGVEALSGTAPHTRRCADEPRGPGPVHRPTRTLRPSTSGGSVYPRGSRELRRSGYRRR